MTTTTAPTTVKLRRAAVISAAVLALGAFAGCGGRDDQVASKGFDAPAPAEVKQDERPPASSSYTADDTSDAPTGSWESENPNAAVAKTTFKESCERSSGGRTSFCECALDELEQAMSFDEFLTQSLSLARGETPSEEFMDAVKACAPSSTPDSASPMNLS